MTRTPQISLGTLYPCTQPLSILSATSASSCADISSRFATIMQPGAGHCWPTGPLWRSSPRPAQPAAPSSRRRRTRYLRATELVMVGGILAGSALSPVLAAGGAPPPPPPAPPPPTKLISTTLTEYWSKTGSTAVCTVGFRQVAGNDFGYWEGETNGTRYYHYMDYPKGGYCLYYLSVATLGSIFHDRRVDYASLSLRYDGNGKWTTDRPTHGTAYHFFGTSVPYASPYRCTAANYYDFPYDVSAWNPNGRTQGTETSLPFHGPQTIGSTTFLLIDAVDALPPPRPGYEYLLTQGLYRLFSATYESCDGIGSPASSSSTDTRTSIFTSHVTNYGSYYGTGGSSHGGTANVPSYLPPSLADYRPPVPGRPGVLPPEACNQAINPYAGGNNGAQAYQACAGGYIRQAFSFNLSRGTSLIYNANNPNVAVVSTASEKGGQTYGGNTRTGGAVSACATTKYNTLKKPIPYNLGTLNTNGIIGCGD